MADNSRPQRTKPRVPAHIRAEIERLYLDEGLTAPDIEKRLWEKVANDRIPDIRTIRRYVQQVKVPKGEAWSLDDCSDPADAPLILEVLAATPGSRFHLTREQAAWIVRVRKAVPDLPPRAASAVALQYMACKQEERRQGALDALLAFAPWRGLWAFQRYHDLLAMKRIPWPGVFWAHARNLKDLWEKMGFDRLLIDKVGADYQRLVQMQAELDTRGQSGPVRRLITMPEDVIIEEFDEDGQLINREEGEHGD